MRLFLSHAARVFVGVCSFAVRRRRPGLLVLVVAGGMVVLVTLVVQVVGPVAIYPFL